ncbi:inactive polyglycylase TTLL10 [Ambystoma mexicanum]|uniref:inactive polyglycylase TTLL10 n=1 Tax=Ambystoma mexicanum TaxID=8296 RepID=UPI0037E97DE6
MQQQEQLLERRGWRQSLQRRLEDPDCRWQLRQKFLEQAKQYIGVPYAQRYHVPGTPEYQSLLFLDCCGLVRRVMRDLKSEFGFMIGPGNQAYQYDTLPVSLSSEEEMKPGDLVFISGTYFNPQRKKQIHDMVHVEIWLGQGQRTLGARWQMGAVQIFDSYRFVSTSYGDMKYHFKSLETWLQGTCVSHCPEHRWGSITATPGKKSIFYPCDDQQEPAEDNWEDPHANALGTSTMQIINGEAASTEEGKQDGNKVPGRPTEATNPAEGVQDGGRGHGRPLEETSGNTRNILEMTLSVSKDLSIGASGDVGEVTTKSVLTREQDEGSVALGDMAHSKGSTEVPDSRADVKASQRPGKVNESKEKISNNKLFSDMLKSTNSKTKMYPRTVAGSKKKNKKGQFMPQKTALDRSDSEPLDEEPKTDQKRAMGGPGAGEKKAEDAKGAGPFFFIGGTNGATLVANYCVGKGWQRLYDPSREDYKLKWCEVKNSATYRSFREGEQLLYQIPNNKILTTKIGILSSLREYDRLMTKFSGARGPRILRIEEFFPETFRLDLREERDIFLTFYKDGQLWICKPTGMNQGRGIFLLKNKNAVTTLCTQLQSLEEDIIYKRGPYRATQARIVQRYIQNPLLIAGRKFDIRSYFLIASTVPYVVLFRHGYVRLTCNTYDPLSDDLTGHLTNQYMQKKNPLYNELKEETVWTMERFNTYVNERYAASKGLPVNWVLTMFTRRMQQIMMHCFMAVKSKLECKMGLFDLFGCDFLIDEDFKVWLLEMNCNPALHTNCEVLKDVIPDVVNETLDLALEVFHKSVKGQRIFPLETVKKFVPLYNGDIHDLRPSKSKTGLSPPKIQRTVRLDMDEFGQAACKGPEKTLKKAWPSVDNPIGNGMRNLSNKSFNRTLVSISQVQMTDLPNANIFTRPLKLKSKSESPIGNSSNATMPVMVCEDKKLGTDSNLEKNKTTTLSQKHHKTLGNAPSPLPTESLNTSTKSNEVVFTLHRQSRVPNMNQTIEQLEHTDQSTVEELASSVIAEAAMEEKELAYKI